MKEKLAKIDNTLFDHDGKVFKVLETKIVNGKAVIITDRKTFVFFESELDDFLSLIWIDGFKTIDESKISQSLPASKKQEIWTISKGNLPLKESPYKAEIIQANELSVRMVSRLESVFNEISDKPGDEVFKKADAMVKAANAIVNVQVASLKYLMLKG